MILAGRSLVIEWGKGEEGIWRLTRGNGKEHPGFNPSFNMISGRTLTMRET